MIEQMKGKMSKKLTLVVSSILFILLTECIGIDIEIEKIISIVGIVISYLAVQSAIDVLKEKTKQVKISVKDDLVKTMGFNK